MTANRLSNMPIGVKDGSEEGDRDGLRGFVSTVFGSGTGVRDASCADGEHFRARETGRGLSSSCGETVRARVALLHFGRFDKPGSLSSFGRGSHRVHESARADYRLADV